MSSAEPFLKSRNQGSLGCDQSAVEPEHWCGARDTPGQVSEEGNRIRPRSHCTKIVLRFSQCAQEPGAGNGDHRTQDTALGSALPGMCSQPSRAVLLQCEALQGPSADNNPSLCALSCSSVNSSSQQLTHLNAPSYLDGYQHLITASPAPTAASESLISSLCL